MELNFLLEVMNIIGHLSMYMKPIILNVINQSKDKIQNCSLNCRITDALLQKQDQFYSMLRMPGNPQPTHTHIPTPTHAHHTHTWKEK